MGAYTSMRNQVNDDMDLVNLGRGGQAPPQQPQQQPQQQPPPLAPAPQQQPKLPPQEEWNQLIGGLNKGYQELDAAGQAQVNDLNHKSESLLAQKGKLRPAELAQAVSSLKASATEYPWDQHVKPPGSNPGDTIEQEGVIKYRNAEGVLENQSYTPDYIKKNTIPIGDSGQLAVPTSPKDGYKVVAGRQRDMGTERQEIDKAEKGIGKIYDGLVKEFQEEVFDADGKSKGKLPMTSAEKRTLNIQASKAFIRTGMQAKHAAMQIMDAGTDPALRGMSGEVKDPFQAEQEMIDTQMQATAARLGRQDAAKEIMAEQGIAPDPSMSPVPEGNAVSEVDLEEITGGSSSGRMTPEERLANEEEYASLRNAKHAVVKSTGGFGDKLAEGATMSHPLQAVSKSDMDARHGDAPEGTVVELAAGDRWIKDDGKFYKIPWTQQDIESETMLDDAGDEIIDPNTGEAAPGIMAQLGAGKSGLIKPTQASVEGLTSLPDATPEQIARSTSPSLGGQPPSPIHGKDLARIGGRKPAAPAEPWADRAGRIRGSRAADASEPPPVQQEFEQAKMHQVAKDDEAYAASARKLRSKGYAHQKVLAMAKPLEILGGSVDMVEAGQPFVTEAGEIYIKLEGGGLDGPYTEDMLKDQTRLDTYSENI